MMRKSTGSMARLRSASSAGSVARLRSASSAGSVARLRSASSAGSVALGAVALATVLIVAGCGDNSADKASNTADQNGSGSSSAGPSSSAPSTSGSSTAPTSTAPSKPPTSTAPTSPASTPGKPTSSTSPGAADHPTKNQGDPRCHTDGLSAALAPQDAAAGNRYASLVLTNTTGKACRIYGYGGVKLGGGANAVPSAQRRDPNAPPELLSLPAGGHAYSTLHWGAVPGTGDAQSGQCEPEAGYLLVTPPDETTSLKVAWKFGPVCERGAIDQSAYRVGSGPSPAGG